MDLDETADSPQAPGSSSRLRLSRAADVARLAGVSTATVDRVLNRRPGVRPMTIRRVREAALSLGYIAEADALDGTPLRPMRIVMLLPAGTNRFLAMLGRLASQIGTAGTPDQPATCRVEWIKSFNPEILARTLLEEGRRVDGIAFMALEHPAVREAVRTLAERGIPTVTLISDIANTPRAAYIGLDNRSAGRTAGYLIARFIGKRPAKVAMVAGSLSYRAHEEREMGFLHVFAEMFPHIEVVGLREGQDDEGQNQRQTRLLLARHPDLAGIYNIGGGAEGIARALKEQRREHDVVLVGHGLTPDTRALLMDGTMDAVITQNPEAAIASCLAVFSNLRDGLDPMHGLATPRCEVIFRENL